MLKSEPFRNSKNSRALLAYLLKCSLAGIHPKEITIAGEVFKKDQHFNPGDDPLVRVHVHNLRKKLDEYYQGEGKTDRYQLQIPKGQYNVQIVDRAKRKTRLDLLWDCCRRLNRFTLLFALAALAAFCLAVYSWSLHRQLRQHQIIDAHDPVWSGFVDNRNATTVVCGDHFFYTLPIDYDKRSVHIRDTWINCEEDLQHLIFPRNETGVKASGQTYFPSACMWALPGIIKVLNSSPRSIILRSSSQLTANAIEEQNMVYIGDIESLGLLNHYVELANLSYDIRERNIRHWNHGDTLRFATVANEDLFHKDYAVIIKWQGPRSNSILLVASFFTIGVQEACRYLTEPNMLKQLEDRLTASCKQVPKNFLMILEVSGIRQAIAESKFVLAESLDPLVLENLRKKVESGFPAKP
ncbi:MAG TPA: helix-turn-helix domain-containing protein [bacterium]|nr:helix-turn-helix domain-containing protein [bacterium]